VEGYFCQDPNQTKGGGAVIINYGSTCHNLPPPLRPPPVRFIVYDPTRPYGVTPSSYVLGARGRAKPGANSNDGCVTSSHAASPHFGTAERLQDPYAF
jgi:hypothetical protein